MNTLSYAIRFWSKGEKRAFFLRHEGYLGAVGAFLKRQPKHWGRRYSFEELNPLLLDRVRSREDEDDGGGGRVDGVCDVDGVDDGGDDDAGANLPVGIRPEAPLRRHGAAATATEAVIID